MNKKSIVASLLMGFFIIACGSGGGGSSSSSTSSSTGSGGSTAGTAPTVTSTTPADSATNVDTASTVTATFDESMLNTSIYEASFTLTSSGNTVPAIVTFDGATNTATLTPNSNLGLLTNYTANLENTIVDIDGDALASKNWSFVTRDGVWGVVGSIGMAEWFINNANVKYDDNGNAIAIWNQDDGTSYNVWVNRYVDGSGWGTAEQISTISTEDTSHPDIAIDANGNAMAVWDHYDGIRNNIWSSRYTVGAGWGTAELVETDNAGTAISPQIAFDSNGNAVAVWAQNDGSKYNVLADRYISGTGWTNTPEIIDNGDGTLTTPEPVLKEVSSGSFFVIWNQRDTGIGYHHVWINRYVDSSGWGTAEQVTTVGSSLQNGEKDFDVDDTGNIMLVRTAVQNGVYGIFANRYAVGTGWGSDYILTTNSQSYFPRIAMDAIGNAIAVWSDSFDTMACRYEVGSGWSAPTTIAALPGDSSSDIPTIQMDQNGNAIVLISAFDSTYGSTYTGQRIISIRYVIGSGWDSLHDIGLGFSPVQSTINKQGNVITVFAAPNNGTVIMNSVRFE